MVEMDSDSVSRISVDCYNTMVILDLFNKKFNNRVKYISITNIKVSFRNTNVSLKNLLRILPHIPV